MGEAEPTRSVPQQFDRRHAFFIITRLCVPILWLVIFAWIVYAYFVHRVGLAIIPRRTFETIAAYYFPLVGLIAFFLVWTQIMLGSMRQRWQRLFPGIVRWHRRIGIFVLLFALLHPLLLLSGVGWNTFFRQAYATPALVAWIWIGEIQLLFLIVTTLTALAARARWLQRRWRAVHLLNYAVFCLVWLHSWFLGTDVQQTSLRWLWYFFAGTFLVAVTSRIIHSLNSASGDCLSNKRGETL